MKTRTIGFLAIALFISFFLDSPVSEFFSMIRNPVLDAIMTWFSHEITVFVILVLVSSLFLYEEHKNKFIPILFLSFFTALLTSYLLKFLFMRARPENVSNMILTIAGIDLSFSNYSFPSTHSAMAFSVLPVLDKEFRKLKIFWLFFSVMIAISRIYLNQHYLSDVIGGIIIGYLTGHYILKLGEKHGIAKRFSEHIRN